MAAVAAVNSNAANASMHGGREHRQPQGSSVAPSPSQAPSDDAAVNDGDRLNDRINENHRVLINNHLFNFSI